MLSATLSSRMPTVTRWLVWPAAKPMLPLAETKSTPAVAVPELVV